MAEGSSGNFSPKIVCQCITASQENKETGKISP